MLRRNQKDAIVVCDRVVLGLRLGELPGRVEYAVGKLGDDRMASPGRDALQDLKKPVGLTLPRPFDRTGIRILCILGATRVRRFSR